MVNFYENKIRRKKRTGTFITAGLVIVFLILDYLAAGNLRQFIVMALLIFIVAGAGYYYLVYEPLRAWEKVLSTPFPEKWRKILKRYVKFYNELDEDEKHYFEKRIQHFLYTKKITGVETTVDDTVKVLIAASAIMPVFAFDDFTYDNIDEILVYPQSFDHDFNTGKDKKILGMVGDGYMNRMMILSKKDLLDSFSGRRTVHNVALHEFIHLIDKKDGSIDGIPEILIDKAFLLPWLKELKKEMDKIKHHKSDIDPYAATSPSEFLAVVAEYFFMSPKKFKAKHPELYKYFYKIFRPKPNYFKRLLRLGK